MVRIWVGARKLSLYDAGKKLGTWTVAVGAPGTPTPGCVRVPSTALSALSKVPLGSIVLITA